ncbi:hypothetical protein J6E39_07415 [bacterium]|nr:hypothetical protein [bacterium]
MFEFLFARKQPKIDKVDYINEIYSKLKENISFDSISQERKKELSRMMKEYGYLNISYQRALEELSDAEILYALEFKWTKNGVFKDNKFIFDDKNISVLARNNAKTSDWIKKEGHDIKLINLAALKDGNVTEETGKFIDWLRQLVILPSGNLANDIYSTTIYLIPFHPREFGCAYLPKSSDISEKLYDENIFNLTGMDSKAQVKTFITLAQLAGHPVIYDILPQTGRFSKAVLANPSIARWFDISKLQEEINAKIDEIVLKLSKKYEKEDVELVKDIYKQNNGSGELSPRYKEIYDDFELELDEIKIKLSNRMMLRANQIKIQNQAREVITQKLGVKLNAKLTEDDIKDQIDIISSLIQKDLWPAPGGAWCSSGVPVYDKMSDCGGYPTFKHYDYKGCDVTNFANLDCQTPYYFAFLENGMLNEPVIKEFINYMKKLQKEYNFDGFRVDHIDHIVDRVSENCNRPISYRAPRVVLGRLNSELKKQTPYFATLAEYMLWDDFLKEYHQDMHFDLLWGNDIVSQNEKNPEKIVEDNQHLANYNVNYKKGEKLSILKTYNNQDGEFRCIDQYPGQLGENGALFKWFKYKFLPGGKFAQRPVLYVDGDESYTARGIEKVIGEEISMKRDNNIIFYNKFDAIDRFVKNNEIISGGEAQIIDQEQEGFAAWLISKEPLKKAFLVVTNYKYPTEKGLMTDENGEQYTITTNGKPVYDKTLKLPGDFFVKGEYVLKDKDFEYEKFSEETSELHFDVLEPSKFKVFLLNKF